MNLAMAVQATLAGDKTVRLTVITSAGMAVTGMTTLAKLRGLSTEHDVVDTAVYRMTITAAFSHWRMLPQRRASFLCMALKAGIVERLSFQG